MQNKKQKQVVVLASPTGGGKTTIAKELMKRNNNCELLVTATTRAPRPGEKDGVDYHFISKEEFLKGIEDGNIPEHYHAGRTDVYYGTYLPGLEKQLSAGKTVIAAIQIIGARFLRKHYNATTIFISPKPKGVLERRIRERDPNITEIDVKERLDRAVTEIKVHSRWYGHIVANIEGKLDDAVSDIEDILLSEHFILNK